MFVKGATDILFMLLVATNMYLFVRKSDYFKATPEAGMSKILFSQTAPC